MRGNERGWQERGQGRRMDLEGKGERQGGASEKCEA